MPGNDENLNICPKCKGTTWISWVDDKGCEVAKRCECFEPMIARRRLINSGITSAFRDKGFKNFDTRGMKVLEEAKKTCVNYCTDYMQIRDSRNNSVLLLGQVGSGKTHLTMAICNALLDYHKVGIRYMGYREMMTKLKQNIIDEREYDVAIGPLKLTPVLVIDDLLKGKVTESDINILFEIINYRYVNALPIIVSSEKSKEELLAFDSAIASRLIEMAKGRIIEIKGNEYNYRLL